MLFSRASQRFGVPIALLFLGVGMLAGSEGIGGIEFNDYQFAFRVGVVALALILFDGGLNTPLHAVRRAAGPAGVLATLGVAGTATLLAVGAHWLGWAGARRCCSARWCRPPTRRRCSRCCAAAVSSSSGGWA